GELIPNAGNRIVFDQTLNIRKGVSPIPGLYDSAKHWAAHELGHLLGLNDYNGFPSPNCSLDGSVMSTFDPRSFRLAAGGVCNITNVSPAPPTAPTDTDITIVRETVYSGSGTRNACVAPAVNPNPCPFCGPPPPRQ